MKRPSFEERLFGITGPLNEEQERDMETFYNNRMANMNQTPGYPIDLHGDPNLEQAYEINHARMPLAPRGRTFIALPERWVEEWARELRAAGFDVRVNPVYGPNTKTEAP